MRTFLVLLAVCAAATAMVPRLRRAAAAEVCAKHTPCAWSIYNNNHIITDNITNTYCICSEDKVCIATEKDTAINTYIFHCRLPSENEDIINS